MIGKRIIDKDLIDKLDDLKLSLSMFILYLGTDGNINNVPANSNTWFLPDYDIEEMFRLADTGEVDGLNWFLVRLLQDKKSMMLLVDFPFKDSKYWRENKERLIEVYIRKLECVIPDISRHIVFKEAATPDTLYKWTLNHRGASYGWASTTTQFAIPGLSQVAPVKDLYLTGHWSTLVQGITGVAYLGRDTARIVLNRGNKK